MASVEFLHFCEYAFFDARGQPCLVGVMGSELYAHSFPLRRASLTIAVALRIKAGETAHIRLEVGPLAGPPGRSWNVTVPGPRAGDQEEGVAFLPFQTVMLFFDGPQAVVARVKEGEIELASKTLNILQGVQRRESPIGPAPPDPHHR